MKQTHTTVIFLELLNHATNQPFPVLTTSSQSQQPKFFGTKPIINFQKKRDCMGIVGDEKKMAQSVLASPKF